MAARWFLALAAAALAGCGNSPGLIESTPEPAKLLWVGDGSAVLAFPLDASGDAAPVVALSGSTTGLISPDAVALDGAGNIYVADFAGRVQVFAPGSTGNVAPLRSIAGAATALGSPLGIGVDGNGSVYVSNREAGTVTVYSPGSSGNVAPVRTITGPTSGLLAAGGNPQQLAVTATGRFWVSLGQGVAAAFAAGANGDPSPTATIAGANTGLASTFGLALDAAGNVYLSALTGSPAQASVRVFASGASGNIAPVRVISGAATGLQFIEGLAVDAQGNVYVADCNAKAILVFGPTAVGNAPPIRTISGATTRLTCPLKLSIY